jgi:hypothetical protein
MKLVGVLLVGVLLALYWWWPGLVGGGDPAMRPAVLVMGNGDLKEAQTVVSRRLIEEGYTVGWIDAPNSWCDIADAFTDTAIQPSQAIVVYVDPTSATASCSVSPDEVALRIAAAANELSQARLVVVTGLSEEPDVVVEAMSESGVRIIDPSDLLGGVDERMDCLWWDDCIPDGKGFGYVIVRDVDGLTLAGQQRVARMIVASVQ